MSEIKKINFLLERGILPAELNYTGYYQSPEFFREKYSFMQNLPFSDEIYKNLAENVKKERLTPSLELEQRIQSSKEKIMDADNIENESQ